MRLGVSPRPVLGKTDAQCATGATGTVSIYTGTPGSETDTGANVTGVFNKFSSLAIDTWVILDWIDGKPYFAGSGRGSRRFKCLLNGALTSGTASAPIDTLTALDGGSVPAATLARNYLHWAGADNDQAIISEDWSSGSLDYLLESVAWDVIPSVTDSLVDNANKKLQKKTTDLLGKANAAQSAATDVDVGTLC